MIKDAMKYNGEQWSDIEHLAIEDIALLDEEIDSDFGMAEAAPFTAWTGLHVYFPAQYDGYEWVGSVPRHPCDKATKHVGEG